MKAKWFVIAVLIGGLGLTQQAQAQHGDHGRGDHGTTKPAVKAPDTLPGIWKAISEKKALLDKTIADKKLSQVHEVAFAIRDLAKLLPDKSKSLSAENQTKLKAWIDGIADSAGKLDEFGDAGNQTNTETEAKRLDILLKSIEKLYPPELLKVVGEEKTQSYTCSMCGGSFDKPGKCPKCGMKLVEKKAQPQKPAGNDGHKHNH